jgi:hypothetical protein
MDCSLKRTEFTQLTTSLSYLILKERKEEKLLGQNNGLLIKVDWALVPSTTLSKIVLTEKII